ncbi:baseplate assembly protein [Devosia sp. SD17-2]|uniref:baseplate assembly protein n=1 Tax=Devosia sp. SD17-2 TaxID=2976459 RepID=UPI0023D832EC|nr:baseplate assembly protein [Devosia sp. SD17-2]WEJ33866.1 baseplate assembly protein [Devosia sp. SD17-2]
MLDLIVGMKADLEMLKTAFGNSLKIGPVAQIDAEKGYRLRLGGKDDEPFLSPWYPHPETGKTSVPLKLKQIVGVVNPAGDPRQGLVFRAGYSDDNPSPNTDMNANVFDDAGVRIEIKDGVLHITAAQHVVVNAPKVSLGGEGGKPVARIGDMVLVGAGSSAGPWPIVEGSSVVSAVD